MSLDRREKTGPLHLAVMASCGRMGSPRVTSVDVAKAAGVSQSTVSLVFSGKAAGRISAATEASVRAVAAELGYRPERRGAGAEDRRRADRSPSSSPTSRTRSSRASCAARSRPRARRATRSR